MFYTSQVVQDLWTKDGRNASWMISFSPYLSERHDDVWVQFSFYCFQTAFQDLPWHLCFSHTYCTLQGSAAREIVESEGVLIQILVTSKHPATKTHPNQWFLPTRNGRRFHHHYSSWQQKPDMNHEMGYPDPPQNWQFAPENRPTGKDRLPSIHFQVPC